MNPFSDLDAETAQRYRRCPVESETFVKGVKSRDLVCSEGEEEVEERKRKEGEVRDDKLILIVEAPAVNMIVEGLIVDYYPSYHRQFPL